jgi:hypothetical protein
VRLRKKIPTQTTSSSNKQDMSKKESDPVGFGLQLNTTKSVKTSSFVIVNKANINTQEQKWPQVTWEEETTEFKNRRLRSRAKNRSTDERKKIIPKT